MVKKEILRVRADEDSIKKIYGKMSKYYAIVEGILERRIRKRGLRYLNIQESETVLEIGFGTGYTLVEIAKSVGKTGKVYGIDLTPEMVELAKGRLEKERLTERVELYKGDARKMPFKKSMFDAVYIALTLELFDTPDIPKILLGIKRVLKPTGRLGVVSIPKEGHEDSKVLKIYEWFYRKFYNYVSCRPIYVEDFIRNAGYEIIKTDEIEIARLFPIKIVVAKSKKKSSINN